MVLHLGDIERMYNFCESEVLGCQFYQGTRSFQLTLDYFWNLSEVCKGGVGPSQPMRLTFTKCRKVIMFSDEGYVMSEVGGGTPLTIISWGDATRVTLYKDLCTNMGHEDMAVYFQLVGPGGDSRILIICQDIHIERIPL
jgi:hypothetical protein